MNFTYFQPTKMIERDMGHAIFANERQIITLCRKGKELEYPIELGIFGQTGTGKSYAAAIVLNQLKCNILFLDPFNRIHTILEKQNEIEQWEFYTIQSNDRKIEKTLINNQKEWRSLKMNARDLTEDFADLLISGRTSTAEQKRTRLKRILDQKNKTYLALKQQLTENDFGLLFEEIDPLLNQLDAGLSIDELCKGKKIIDISSLGKQNRVIAGLIKLILNRRKHEIKHYDPLLICLDEATEYASGDSEMARTMAAIATGGRQFNIHLALFGQTPRRLNTIIRSQLTIFICFLLNDADIKMFGTNFGVDLFYEDFEKIRKPEKGWCLYFNKNDEAPNTKIINFNLDYQKFKRTEFAIIRSRAKMLVNV